MGKPQRVAAHFPDDLHIDFVVFDGQCIAHALAVLMPGAAPEGIAPSVQKKALLGINLVFAAAKASRHAVTAGQGGCCRIQIGIVDAVPQVNILNMKLSLCITVYAGNGYRLTGCFHCNRFGISLPGLNRNHSGFCFQIHHGSDLNAGSTTIGQLEMGFGYNDQIHAAVQAAIEGEVRFLGIYPVIVGIVHPDHQLVFFLQIVQLNPEGAVAAFVMGKPHTIPEHFGSVGCTKDFQPDLVSGIQLRFVQLPGIIAGAAVIIIAAVLPVNSVPGMGQGDSLDSFPGVPLGEQPIVMNWKYFTHNRTPLLKKT